MHPRINNLIQKPKGIFSRGLGIYLSVMLAVQPAHAKDVTGNAKFLLTVAAIVNLNTAMQAAAENPMDKWRRQNVAHAMAMLPIAIVGLAEEFKANRLVDSDYPTVQAMLGGFVDVNAADRYKKFLKNPSPALIPQVGKGFPGQMISKGSSGAKDTSEIVYNDNANKLGFTESGSLSSKTIPNDISSELVDLSSAPAVGSLPAAQPNQPADNFETVYNADAQKLGEETNSVSTGGANSIEQAAKDLAAIEGKTSFVEEGLSVERAPAKVESSLSSEREFFNQKKANKKSKLVKGRESAKEFELKTSPKYWRVVPLLTASQVAHAEQKEESGEKSGQALMALAMMMMGIAPMVAAAVQASADKAIAKTNAEAQITMAKISADTSKYLAKQQKDVALTQAEISKNIAEKNQQGTTQRLGMQLAELGKARDQANALEEKKRSYQAGLDGQRAALAQYQADQTIKLANMQFRAGLSAAGLSQGFARTTNSGGALTRTGALGGIAPNALGGTGLGTIGTALSAQQSTALGAKKATVSSKNKQATQGLGVAGNSSGANRLLNSASVDQGNSQNGEWVIDPKTKKKVFKPAPGVSRGVASGSAASRGVTSVTASSTLKTVMNQNTVVRGSTLRNPVRQASGSDLENYTAATAGSAAGFSNFYEQEQAVVPQLPVAPQGHSKVPASGAYNAEGLEGDSNGVRRAYRGAQRPVSIR